MKLPLTDGTTREVPGVTAVMNLPEWAAKYKWSYQEIVRKTVLSQVAEWIDQRGGKMNPAEIAEYIRQAISGSE